jgi:hypothetical protein
MRKCLFERGDLLEQLEDAADKAGIQELAAEVSTIQAMLLPTLTAQQREIFRQFDDAVVREGTARVNAALMLACGCRECKPVQQGTPIGGM